MLPRWAIDYPLGGYDGERFTDLPSNSGGGGRVGVCALPLFASTVSLCTAQQLWGEGKGGGGRGGGVGGCGGWWVGSSHQGGQSVREGVGRSLGCRVDHSRVRQADHCLQVVGTRQGSEITRERDYTEHHKEDLLHALYTREHSSSRPLPQSLCDLHNFSLVTHILDKRLVLQIGSHSFTAPNPFQY